MHIESMWRNEQGGEIFSFWERRQGCRPSQMMPVESKCSPTVLPAGHFSNYH
jgi:hypothetical protein